MPIRPNMKNALLDNRINAIRKAHLEANISRAELDLSGGVDSAVMACILVLALGPERVTLVHSRFSTNPEQTERAHELAAGLNCPLIDIDLSGVWNALLPAMKDAIETAYGPDVLDGEVAARIAADPTILGSIRSTLRAPIGRGFNRLTGGGLRHGTGNECEDRYLRFYQKGGDGEVDSNPIAMLSKGEVYQLAWWCAQRIPAAKDALYAIISATPSPDLWGNGDGHNDEDELLSWTGAPFTYSRIDLDTGEYAYVGTIERVSRFLDLSTTFGRQATPHEFVLFMDSLSEEKVREYIPAMLYLKDAVFAGLDGETVERLLMAARKTERVTRHKMNPNCPSYGTRQELLVAGILTNDLPVKG